MFDQSDLHVHRKRIAEREIEVVQTQIKVDNVWHDS